MFSSFQNWISKLWQTIASMETLTQIKIGLLAVFILGTNFETWNQLFHLFGDEQTFKKITLFLLTWIAVLISCIIIAWYPTRYVRVLWALPIVVSSFIAGAFTNIVGNPMSFADLQMYWAMRADAEDAIYSYWLGMLIPLFLAALGFIGFYLNPSHASVKQVLPDEMPREQKTLIRRVAGGAPIIPAILIGLIAYGIGGRFTAAMPAQYKSLTLLGLTVTESYFKEFPERDNIYFEPSQAPAIKHILYVVDESISGDFVDLNANRGTTPYLLTQKNKIANFGYAAAGHNCSDQSNALLRWGVAEDGFKDAFTRPTLWQYAKTAGFETTHIDVQKRDGFLQNYMSVAEKAQIDAFIQYNDVPSIERDPRFLEKDLNAARQIRSLLKREKPQLIVITKEGLHFPYEGKYPESEAHFDNHMALLEPFGSDRTRLLNSYKNGVMWAVNAFFKVLLDDLDLTDTLIIYTADHGQNLMDQGIPTHCRSVNPHYTEGLVPLFTLTENQEVHEALLKSASVNKDAASHKHIFPTLLSLFGYPMESIREHYGNSLYDTIDDPQGFAYGFVFDKGGDWGWSEMPETIRPRTEKSAQKLAIE